MYDTHLRYLASVYLDAESITSNPKDIKGLMDALADDRFVPTPAFEDTEAGRVSRIGFMTPEPGWQVVLLGKRFNVALLPTEFTQNNLGEFSDFCEKAASILGMALDYFQRKAHRLAAVQEGFLAEMPPGKMESIAQAVLSLPNDFVRDVPFEWDWRAATVVNRSWGEVEEPTFTIVTIKRGSGQIRVPNEDKAIQFDRVRVDLDLSTSNRNRDARFDTTNCHTFFNQAAAWHSDIQSDISGFLSQEIADA